MLALRSYFPVSIMGSISFFFTNKYIVVISLNLLFTGVVFWLGDEVCVLLLRSGHRSPLSNRAVNFWLVVLGCVFQHVFGVENRQ
jgi:hypothetical protein